MANQQLTPELLARILASQEPEYYDEASGQSFMPTYGTGRYEGESNYIPGEVTGFRGYKWAPGMYSDNYELNGTQYDQYDAQGNHTGQGTWEGLKKNSAMDTLLPLAMVAAPFALSMFPALGAAASFGTNPVLSGASASGFAPGAAGAVGGGVGAAGGSLSGLPGGAGMDVAGFEGLTAADVGLGGGAAGGAAGAAGTGASLLDGASKYLGPAATLLGAAAGAKGQGASQTSVKSMDPRMDALFYGDLAPRIQGLLARQMAPGAMQGFTDMQSVGRGLLNAPVAGNGFNRFFPGR